ncbi:MAG: hypothetical protein OEM39_00180 [Acidimicrobiia bacterium]|nr:hypothetical protein [Acidimicrobiia bacterium]
MFGTGSSTHTSSGFNLFRVLRRLTVFLFALIQAILVARILVDLGIIPIDNGFSDFIVTWSNILAAPVQGIGSGVGALFGGGGIDMIAGEGIDPVIVIALIGWSVIEPWVMRVVRKFEEV